MKNKTVITLTTILPMLCISAVSQAATLAEFKVTDTQGRMTQTAYISNGKVSVQNPDDLGGTELLYNSRNDQIDVIQHSDRSYSSIDRTTVDNLAGQAAGVRDMIAGNTTPDQQVQLAGMLESVGLSGLMQQPSTTATRYVKTSEQRNISGYACHVVRLFRNDQLETVMCVASQEELSLPEADYNALRSMLAFSSHLAGQASTLLGDVGATLPDFDTGKIEGLPIAVTDLDDGVTVVLQRMAQMPDKPGSLVVPKGYSETTLPGIW